MPDWDYVQGSGSEYGMGDPDFDHHDPAGHCGGGRFGGRRGASSLDDEHPDASWDFGLVFGGPAGSEKRVRCNRCGSTDVRWRQQGGRWVLFNLGVGEHVCTIDDSAFSAAED